MRSASDQTDFAAKRGDSGKVQDFSTGSAERTVSIEIRALQTLHKCLAPQSGLARSFETLAQRIFRTSGRVIVTGVGKSGHIGTKIAATLASTGTPAFFIHAGEASHGDLGMIVAGDLVLALSWSGESDELAHIVDYCRRQSIPLAAMTSRPHSTLARTADIALLLPEITEACPNGLAPTSSAIVILACGDALAMTLLEARGFSRRHFRNFHPGGRIGAQLRLARDIMHDRARLPLAPTGCGMDHALVTMTGKGFGILGVVDDEGRLVGVITDGDLRRAMSPDLLQKTVADVMTRNPRCVGQDTLAGEILDTMNRAMITAAFVVHEERPVGLIHMHDLIRLGVV